MTIKEKAEKYAFQYYGYDDPRLYAVKRAYEAGMESMKFTAELAFITLGKFENRDAFSEKLKEV